MGDRRHSILHAVLDGAIVTRGVILHNPGWNYKDGQRSFLDLPNPDSF